MYMCVGYVRDMLLKCICVLAHVTDVPNVKMKLCCQRLPIQQRACIVMPLNTNQSVHRRETDHLDMHGISSSGYRRGTAARAFAAAPVTLKRCAFTAIREASICGKPLREQKLTRGVPAMTAITVQDVGVGDDTGQFL